MGAAQITKAGAAVAIAHASKRFRAVQALRDVSLAIGPGMVQCFIGPAGAGKSTLLRCIGGSEAVDEGTITIDGELIGREGAGTRHVIGTVPQPPELFDHMTALQHILEGPLALLRRSRRDTVVEAMAALERVGLADRRDSYPSELSGGARQRLAIARALAAKPRLMLLDEPTAGLDPEEAGEVLAMMRNFVGSGLTLIVATHDIGFVREVADDVAFMDTGEIVERGRPEELIAAPKQARTRDFLATLGG
ncbi:ABC transporter ATP-binding protein [Bosea sp. ANAM02]|nr:ABC transporter ATP-binding protein [Bosea sp. ANAM02]